MDTDNKNTAALVRGSTGVGKLLGLNRKTAKRLMESEHFPRPCDIRIGKNGRVDSWYSREKVLEWVRKNEVSREDYINQMAINLLVQACRS